MVGRIWHFSDIDSFIGDFKAICTGRGIFVPGYLHVLSLPFLYPLYISLREKHAVKGLIFFALILSTILFNYFYLDPVLDYYAYGSQKELQEKHIKIAELQVYDKSGVAQTVLIPEGKLLLDFWSLSCPACVRHKPIVDSFCKANPSLKVYSMMVHSVHDTAKEWKKLRETQATYPLYYLDGSVMINKLGNF